MLIVVSITVLLLAAAVTRMRPALESRRMREAARAVNVYLGSARNRAMETGRSCGVILNPLSATLACALSIDQCEIPAPYCGDAVQSLALVTLSAANTITATLDAADSPYKLLRQFDQMQLNYQGPYFPIQNPNDQTSTDPEYLFIKTPVSGSWTLTLDATGQSVPWTAATMSVPYRIRRSPGKGVATPLQLPASTVIDLNFSGIDNGTLFNSGSVIILFSPNGGIDCVWVNGSQSYVSRPIFLLVGKRERVGNAAVPSQTADNRPLWANWQDLENVWVMINPQTGLITTGEVASAATISDSRTLARDAQSLGGR